MLADRVRMGVYSEELPIYLFESGTDSYLNWEISSDWNLPDTSYSNSDFIHLFGVPHMDWGGHASLYNIDKGKRNWLEVTFSHDQQIPSFSEQETLLFDISEFTPKTIYRLRFHVSYGGWVRLEGDKELSLYLLPDMGTAHEEAVIRLYSICLKRGEGFGEPILTEPGIFLDRWTAFGTGTGVGQVYDNRLYLTSDKYNAGVGDAAQFLSDPVKVSSDALRWLMTTRAALGGESRGFFSSIGHAHGIPIGTIVKIGITLTCTQAAIGTFMPARFELEISIMGEYGGLLVSWLISDFPIEQPVISIDSLKFT